MGSTIWSDHRACSPMKCQGTTQGKHPILLHLWQLPGLTHLKTAPVSLQTTQGTNTARIRQEETLQTTGLKTNVAQP